MIFLSYVSEDRSRVRPFYDLLEAHNLNPWMDCKSILVGQNWDYEIKTALDRADIIVVFVSKNSVDKRGYAQREIHFAIEKIKEKLAGDIYVIPIQLDPVDFPPTLKEIQFLQTDGKEQAQIEAELLQSIEAAQRKADEVVSKAQSEAEVRWEFSTEKSAYSGIPGYATTLQRVALSSTRYAHVREISDHINGVLSEQAMAARRAALTPDSSLYNLMQDEWKRTHTFDALFQSIQVVGRVLSVEYMLHWYNAGAVHPFHSPKSFNYLLEPVVFLKNFKELFRDERALGAVQIEVEKSLVEVLSREETGSDSVDIGWIREGTKDWASFSDFSFTDKGMLVHFGSYQVSCYADGTPTAKVPFESIVPYLADDVLHALGLYR